MKTQLKLVSCLLMLLLNSCGSQAVFPSVEFDSCFMNYTNVSELEEKLKTLSDSIDLENPNPPVMTVVGCLHYQMNQTELAKQWLKKAWAIAKEKSSAKNTSASALGLIHLKNQEHQLITPYIMAAQNNHLGRWMLVLYYIDFYRKYDNTEYLGSAIKYMQEKHENEGQTPATQRFLTQMTLIQSMETICRDAPDGEACQPATLNEEKRYLFSTAWGFLSMLLKQPPFNSI